VPRHKGTGFEALDLESRACFVPDDSYRLLDDIIIAVSERVNSASRATSGDSKAEHFLSVSRIVGEVLAEKGFGLYAPTETLGDALASRQEPGKPPRHITDSDTSSLILLTVAENLGLPAALVEITSPGGNGLNFVRWQIDDSNYVDWDPNVWSQCTAPKESPHFEGKPMTRKQIASYLVSLRGDVRRRISEPLDAIQDYREAIALFPEHPRNYNELVWTVATRDFRNRDAYKGEGLAASEKLLSIAQSPSYLDTVACLHAYLGDFVKALAYEEKAIVGEPHNQAFKDRAKLFASFQQQDCTGQQ
jgi:hypothetical protein